MGAGDARRRERRLKWLEQIYKSIGKSGDADRNQHRRFFYCRTYVRNYDTLAFLFLNFFLVSSQYSGINNRLVSIHCIQS